jgi:LDH2 family malate/lactate/ureidoglycolate dehydrogenase
MGNNYKGSAIMLLLEILTGSLINSSMGRTADQASFPYGFGGMLICIDINSFTDIDKFKKETSLMLNQIRDSKPADGFNEVILPGDGSIKRMNLANEEVEIDDVFYNRLKELLK